MDFMKYKLFFFIVSVIIILPGLFFLATSGLKLGIDFTGGGLLEYKFEKPVAKADLEKYGVVTTSGENAFIIRTSPQEFDQLQQLRKEIASSSGTFETLREENVGPTIGKELEQRASIAIGLAILAILLYVTLAFRKVLCDLEWRQLLP
jgi:preprotein translocase subunit SecF